MSDAIHRTTLKLRKSVNTPDFPVADWILNPDLSAVSGVEKKYWKIIGDSVVEQSSAEKEKTDADITTKTKNDLEVESQTGILKAVISAFVKTVNKRFPAGQKITTAEIRTAIKGEL